MQDLVKLMVVDDDEDLLTIIGFCFSEHSTVKLHCVASGEQALHDALEFQPDCILLDIMLPGMDGLAVLKALRLIPQFKKTMIVFLTAKVHKKEIDEYLAKGADGVIVKPFDPIQLPHQVFQLWNDFQRKQ